MPCEMLRRIRVDQPHGGAEEPRDLRVVSACVRRSGRSVSLRMTGHHQRIELAEHGERRPVARLPAQVRAYARDGEAALRRETELPERLFDELRGLEFLEAQPRVRTDRSPSPMISSARASIATSTCRLRSAFVMIVGPLRIGLGGSP